ncbi:MAG TPA: hypothetical protein VE224_10770, partial [Pseudolabrys sp.]|nr:hypothetical protein [Pseudolabrys sp.]
MSAPQSSERRDEGRGARRSLAALWLVTALAAAGMIVIAVFWPPLAAAGWLIGFVLLSAIPLGSLYLLMIH